MDWNTKTVTRPVSFDDMLPIERAAWLVEKFGDFAPLEDVEAAAILRCAPGTFEVLGVPPSEVAPRTKRYLWGTLKQALKDAERAA